MCVGLCVCLYVCMFFLNLNFFHFNEIFILGRNFVQWKEFKHIKIYKIY